jgi:hypothetical protein
MMKAVTFILMYYVVPFIVLTVLFPKIKIIEHKSGKCVSEGMMLVFRISSCIPVVNFVLCIFILVSIVFV